MDTSNVMSNNLGDDMPASQLPHQPSTEGSPSSGTGRPYLNREVRLDELSKFFNLPEKAVAKELGICLTSLKKLCRSYGITRWPFRKLKSLQRTMKKVETESQIINACSSNNAATPVDANKTNSGEVRRKPYTVGNKTVFLSDEELEVYKMTMGKDSSNELKPTPLVSLEPSLFSNANMQAASNALASVARGSGLTASAWGGGGYEGNDEENPPISAEVKGRTLVIVNWSSLWSQAHLKIKLLDPLEGVSLRVSPDGIRAELDFAAEETAKRAHRICQMAEVQAMQSAMSTSSAYPAPNIQNPPSQMTSVGTAGTDSVFQPSSLSGSVHSLLSDNCGIQPPSTHMTQSMWTTLFPGNPAALPPQSFSSGAPFPPVGHKHTPPPPHWGNGPRPPFNEQPPKQIGLLGEISSPPISGAGINFFMEQGTGAPLSMGTNFNPLFPAGMFQSGCMDGTSQGMQGPPMAPESHGGRHAPAYFQRSRFDIRNY